MKRSPWGQVDFEYPIAKGVVWVSTPGHGGLLVAKKVAREKLSATAYLLGNEWGSYVAYEEDCDYAIAFSERPEWAARLDEVEFELFYGRQPDGSPKKEAARALLEERRQESLAARRWRYYLVVQRYTDYAERVMAGTDRYPRPAVRPIEGGRYAVVCPWNKEWDGLRVTVEQAKRTRALCVTARGRRVRVPFDMLTPAAV